MWMNMFDESLCINRTSNVHESFQDNIRQLHEIGRLSSTRLVISDHFILACYRL